MNPHAARICFAFVAVAVFAVTGCRAIGRFGESRQSIAARRLSGQGFQAMHDGRWDVAETLFADALEASKADDRAHWGLAEAYWKRGEQQLAVQHMEQAVRLSAGEPKFIERLGRMYLETGRGSDADSQSLIALQTKRDSPDAWRLRGDCLRAAGKDDEALAAYHRALALQPDYPEVQLQAAEIYLVQERYDRLLATLDRLQEGVGTDDSPAKADMLQGIAMRHLGRKEEAKRCFARAAEKNPADAAPHLEIASLAIENGDMESARRSLASATQLGAGTAEQEIAKARLQPQHLRMASFPLRSSETPQPQR